MQFSARPPASAGAGYAVLRRGEFPVEHDGAERHALRLPLIAALKYELDEDVRTHDRDLVNYFCSSSRIDEDDRTRAAPTVVELIERANPHQAWVNLLERARPAMILAAVWPAPWVYGLSALVLARPALPMWAKLVLAASALAFVIWAFLARLRDPLVPTVLWPYWSAGTTLATASVLALWPGGDMAALLAVAGSALLGIVISVLAASLLAQTVKRVSNVKPRAALYLVELGVFAGALTTDLPRWPDWLTRGVWVGLWSSTALAIALGLSLLVAYAARSVYERWKNQKYVVEELVQTLLWVALSLDDAKKQAEDRTESSREYPLPTAHNLAWELEYIADLLEHAVPRQLQGFDRHTNREILDHCRGIATAVRELKLGILLNQGRSLDPLATALVNAVVPIALGNWSALACTTSGEQPSAPSTLSRTLTWLGRLVVALAPLATAAALHLYWDISDELSDAILPLAATWLFVSVATWIDPGSGDRAKAVPSLLGALPGVRTS